MQALLLPIAGDLYAVALTDIREVVPAPMVTPVPRAPATVLGVFNLRGEVVPLLDTAAMVGVPGSGRVTHVAITRTDLGLAGLAADGLPRKEQLGAQAGEAEFEHAVGRFAVGGAVATLLDLDGLLEEVAGS